MDLFDYMARLFGVNEPAPGGEVGAGTATAGAGATSQPPVDTDAAAHHPYRALWQSVERHLAMFMTHSVAPHRQFEPEDVFSLVRIQVTGTNPQSQAVLDRFLGEFRPDSRRRIVLHAVQRSCPQGVGTEAFADFNRDFDAAQLAEVDPYAAQLSEANEDGYRVTLFGEWVHRPETASAKPPGAVSTGTPPAPASAASPAADGTPVSMQITDARGQRSITLDALPFVLGREARPGQGGQISGTYLSRRHGLLDRDAQGRLWYRDTSVNGSLLDGAPVRPGERRALRIGSLLVLGGDGASAADGPQLRITAGAEAADEEAGVTPLWRPASPPAAPAGTTPLNPKADGRMAAASATASATASAATAAATPMPAVLCLLAVQDAQGSRTVAVTRLPCVIGRDEQADCQVPAQNAGVSRQHLVIAAINAQGAQIINHGGQAQRWGTEVDGVAQPAQFTLAWNATATLAARYRLAPSVSLRLLKPGA